MLELKAKQELARAAKTLAQSYELVQHNTTTYIPADWQTEEVEPLPPIEQRIWLPLSRTEKRRLANHKSNILFATDAEMSSFDYMLRQYATEDHSRQRGVFIRTTEGLRVLDETGELVEPDGTFRANYIRPMLNESDADKKEVFMVIVNWLESEDEAHSLLHHLATALAPGWSAVKYVLLLGEGRNGKSLLLTMLVDLFGEENVSNIERQAIAEKSPTVVELNNKLLNVVFDGKMDYIKDSGLEKTLIAGEPGYIRLLYESGTTKVQTTGLFLEGLNKEPKSRDKSSALQKRIVRYWFPKIYPLDRVFERRMRSPQLLGAFLSLLIDHYVKPDEVAEKLAQSKGSADLQLEQMWSNSPVLQYVQYLVMDDPTMHDKLAGKDLDPLINSFMAWRIQEGFSEMSSADTVNLFKECFEITWKTARVNGAYARKRIISGIKAETEALLAQLKEGIDDGPEAEGPVVED